MSVVSSLIFATHRYLKERLGLLWRERLTRELHEKYFHAMTYYKVSHLNKSRITDVEERIVKDPRRFTKALADEMEKISAAMTSGVWFTYKLTAITSLPFAISPLLYFYASFKAAMYFAPNWSAKWRQMLDLRSKYFSTQARLQTHAEAVCAYQGNAVERSIIDSAWEKFLKFCIGYVKDATLFQFVSSAFFQYGAHSFAEALIIGSFFFGERAAMRNASSISAGTSSTAKVKSNARLFGEVRYITEYFIRAMSAQGVIISCLRQLQQMAGPAKRLTQLFDTLRGFHRAKELDTTFVDDPNRIEFKNCQVYTPTGNLLLKDLSFGIKKGTNMLLTGCNGSGKSSLFRCLGGLWNLPEGGTIVKPGGDSTSLNDAVFYVPQKPYNVLGTLREQLCYPSPKSRAEAITKEELRELLAEVDLAYLMDRGPQGPNDDKEVDWEAVLSMGEKQRLAMARLFWHAPQFAILDECTSGVSAAMEKRMYDTCAAKGITCITISHRPVLRKYHDCILNILKDGKGGWTWTVTNLNSQRLASFQGMDVADEGGHEAWGGVSKAYLEGAGEGDALVEKKRLEARSAKYKAEEAPKEVAEQAQGKKHTTWSRLYDVLSQGFMPRGLSLGDPESLRILGLAGMVIGKTVGADFLAAYDGYILSTVIQPDFWVLRARRQGRHPSHLPGAL